MLEKLSARGERVERLIEILAEKQTRLDDVLVILTEAQIKTEERFQETDKLFRQTARRFEQTGQRLDRIAADHDRLEKLAAEEKERGRKLDERIDKLVSAIGEMLRTRNGDTHQ